jgi:guanylate kinase
VYGNYYGTSRKWIEGELEGDHDVLLEIDWQGAHQVKKLFPHAVGISILPPSIEELRRRLEARGKDSRETIEKRMAGAREEISHALDFQYIIVNESFEEAVTDLQSIVRAARLSRPQQEARLAQWLEQFR